MGDRTKIEWTDATWNPVTGCTRISPGCDHCYIDRSPPFRIERRRFVKECAHCSGDGFEPMTGKFRGSHACSVCSGDGEVASSEVGASTGVRLHRDRLEIPLRWRKPRRVFVCSLADLFHDEVSDEYIARVFAVMGLARAHTFQVLTKRPARMRALLSSSGFLELVTVAMTRHPGRVTGERLPDMPFPNVWVGTTVENQEWADRRIPILLDIPAAVRFLSVEPMLGPVNLCTCYPGGYTFDTFEGPQGHCAVHGRRVVDWVICGGESGPGARPMHTQWVRDLRDECTAASVAFHFKQWGEWARTGQVGVGWLPEGSCYGSEIDVPAPAPFTFREILQRVGKRQSGRVLDGRTWDEYPQEADAARLSAETDREGA